MLPVTAFFFLLTAIIFNTASVLPDSKRTYEGTCVKFIGCFCVCIHFLLMLAIFFCWQSSLTCQISALSVHLLLSLTFRRNMAPCLYNALLDSDHSKRFTRQIAVTPFIHWWWGLTFCLVDHSLYTSWSTAAHSTELMGTVSVRYGF